MQTIEITNPMEARRCRYAQYRGEGAQKIDLNWIAGHGDGPVSQGRYVQHSDAVDRHGDT